MSTGTVVGLFVGAFVALGLGIFTLVMSIKGLASSAEPDITASSGGRSAKVGRGGLIFFLAVGVLVLILGIALLYWAIRGATGS